MCVRFIDTSFALFYVIFYSLPANYVYLIDIPFSLSSVFLNKLTCFGLFFQKTAIFHIKKSWHAFCYINIAEKIIKNAWTTFTYPIFSRTVTLLYWSCYNGYLLAPIQQVIILPINNITHNKAANDWRQRLYAALLCFRMYLHSSIRCTFLRWLFYVFRG